jgi:hypothetical protein
MVVDARLAAGSTGLRDRSWLVTRLKTEEGICTLYSSREEDRHSFDAETWSRQYTGLLSHRCCAYRELGSWPVVK